LGLHETRVFHYRDLLSAEDLIKWRRIWVFNATHYGNFLPQTFLSPDLKWRGQDDNRNIRVFMNSLTVRLKVSGHPSSEFWRILPLVSSSFKRRTRVCWTDGKWINKKRRMDTRKEELDLHNSECHPTETTQADMQEENQEIMDVSTFNLHLRPTPTGTKKFFILV